jgi:hypothetical protein
MFFVRFIPTFPVLHRATFVFRESTQPLLLNAMAIGSLYLGPKDSIAKGEALWRLAHIAVATNWETLITHRGPYDSCKGVQLVLTALLGQVYGALSKVFDSTQRYKTGCSYINFRTGMSEPRARHSMQLASFGPDTAECLITPHTQQPTYHRSMRQRRR